MYKIKYCCFDWDQNVFLLYLSLITQRDVLYKKGHAPRVISYQNVTTN